MKNIAPRVGAPRGAGGRAVRPPQEAQGRKPRARQPAGRDAPRRIKKGVRMAGARGGDAGGKPRRAADEGKPLQPRTATHRASRKKPGEADLCARRSRSPQRGRARWRAGRTRRRSPTRATRGTREKHDMTMWTVGMCLENDGGKGQPLAEIRKSPGTVVAIAPRPAGGGRFRKPPSRGRATSVMMQERPGTVAGRRAAAAQC